MEIRIQLPRASEADVDYDAKSGVLTIRPLFRLKREQRPIFFAEARGKKGRIQRSVVAINSGTGKLVSQEVKAVEAEFDQTDPED